MESKVQGGLRLFDTWQRGVIRKCIWTGQVLELGITDKKYMNKIVSYIEDLQIRMCKYILRAF